MILLEKTSPVKLLPRSFFFHFPRSFCLSMLLLHDLVCLAMFYSLPLSGFWFFQHPKNNGLVNMTRVRNLHTKVIIFSRFFPSHFRSPFRPNLGTVMQKFLTEKLFDILPTAPTLGDTHSGSLCFFRSDSKVLWPTRSTPKSASMPIRLCMFIISHHY